MEEGIRDPVVVYEYLQRFYVQEGNKRVSVLRSLDVPTITASITRVLPLPSDDPAIRCYNEFSRLFRVAPIYGLVFSEEIASMRWLNENVVGRLPKSWELSREGADAVAASGVVSAATDAEES